MCAHLLDKGWKEPRCVDACPTGALLFGEESELEDVIAGAQMLKPEAEIWFERLEPGLYSLRAEKDGYVPKTMGGGIRQHNDVADEMPLRGLGPSAEGIYSFVR
ncbi:MAG: hypothetical protein M1274_03470 [Actinobacteria bacterium]|nr:hypothetical protein [Actinomycetota bacterium]